MAETIFSRIVSGQIPCDKLYEDDLVLAFRDINPQAPVHVIVIPKVAVATTDDLGPEHEALAGRLIIAAAKIARDLGVAQDGYRLVINCRNNGGQTVYHLHLHLLGGRALDWPPG